MSKIVMRIVFFCLLFQFVPILNAQIAYEVRAVQLIRSAGFWDIDIEIRSTGATPFVLGTSSFVFNYNTSGLHASAVGSQRKVAANDGPWDAQTDDDFVDVSTSAPVVGTIGLIVDINTGGTDANGLIVPSSFTRVGTLRLIIDNSSLSSQLTWSGIAVTTVIQRFTTPGDFAYPMTNITANGTFTTPADTPLPIQMISFIGVTKGNKIQLTWKTATELNSSAFEIERRTAGDWKKIGELQAAGTSNASREYTYVDEMKNIGSSNILYRLKTIDTDGSFKYSGEVEVTAVPQSYELRTNFPNPFNPQTKIQYSLPENAQVHLSVYDVIGRQVADLVNEEQSAGYYEKTFTGSNLSSGLYFYRITAQAQGKNVFSQVKKMLLVK